MPYFNDLLDDLDHRQLTLMIQSMMGKTMTRANIKQWRKSVGLPV